MENVHPAAPALAERFHTDLYPIPKQRVLDDLPHPGWLVPFVDRVEGSLKRCAPASNGNMKFVADLKSSTKESP